MEKPKYIVTADITLPALNSGIKPYRTFEQFPSLRQNFRRKIIISIQRLWALLKWAKECQVLVLDSTSGPLQPDLLICILIRFFRKKPIVIMTGDMWNKGNAFKYILQKLIIRLADPSIQRYVVHSLGEEKIFGEVWGVSPKKVRSCIYNYTFTDEEVKAGEITTKGYIFAGGNPARDYDSLIESARLLPKRNFIIATRMLEGYKNIPSNLKVVQTSHQEFIQLMREADMVITPLRSGLTRSAGQQTYLNAMRMGKISIVNGKDVYGVTDYIQNQINGIIVDGSPKGYADVIEWVYDATNQATTEKIKRSAQESVLEFTYKRYIDTMSSIIQEAVDEAGIK